MNYQTLQKRLESYNDVEVSIYVAYLKKLQTDTDRDGKLRNKWFSYFKEDKAADLFIKVSKDDLFIDGETITLTFKGAVMVSYNYQAYKNKLLKVYPESKFDLQNVYQGDNFKFRKESGRVIYTHDISDPFSNNKILIGTYCIIKNNRGEFIETLNTDEITKMRNVAKTQNIWNNWFGEMVLKSVIKRACKRHFKDVTTNIETLDNENYAIENVNLDSEIQELIEKCESLEDLGVIYEENKSKVSDEPAFLQLLTSRKQELSNQ